jgi:hypothetical protein
VLYGFIEFILIEKRPTGEILNTSAQKIRQYIPRRFGNIRCSSRSDGPRANLAKLICLNRDRHRWNIHPRV